MDPGDRITDVLTDTFETSTDTDKMVFNKDFYKAKREAC